MQDGGTNQIQTLTEIQSGTADAELGKKPYFVIDPGPPICKTDSAGLAFDFNYGIRVKVPEGDWRVKFIDRDAGVTLYDAKASKRSHHQHQEVLRKIRLGNLSVGQAGVQPASMSAPASSPR